MQTEQQAPLSHPKYRPDIDGLRAVAVLAVIAFHAFPKWLRGGFIGVDVFFVISGYLISSIIFENLDKGTFSFLTFYARRIRRIFPALILVLIACFAFGWFSLFPDEFAQLGKHIAGGAGFVSNIILWKEAGYFDNSADTKPLLHLWSLGIEEQFYIIWPLLIWFAWKRNFNLLTVTILVAVVSFILNVKGVKHHAVADFYSPQTRFWELLSGAILAWVTLYKAEAFERIKNKADRFLIAIIYRDKHEVEGKILPNLLSFLGLLLLVYGFERIHKELLFPGKWALVPVLGTILIIAAGSKAWVNREILSNRFAVGLGLISYPLYLWHWPLLSFARIVDWDIPSREIRIAAILLSIILAWVTYKLIECPIRFGKRGTPTTVGLAALVFIVGSIGYITFEKNGFDFRTSLLHLSPPIEKLVFDDPALHSACMNMYGLGNENIRWCRVSGDKKPHIALIGDSHAAALFSGLSKELKNVNNEGLLLMGGRLFINVAYYANGDQVEIDAYKGGIKATNFVATEKSIDTVIVVSNGPGYINDPATNFYLLNDRSITDKKKVFEIGLRKTLDLLVSNNKRIIFVLDTPELNFDPQTCQESPPLRVSKKPSDCVIPIDAFQAKQKPYRDLVFTVLKDYPTVKLFDAAAYLCDKKSCTARVDSKTLYGDTNHLSVAGSEYLAHELIKVINGENSLLLDAK